MKTKQLQDKHNKGAYQLFLFIYYSGWNFVKINLN